jgi:hypothetical protein
MVRVTTVVHIEEKRESYVSAGEMGTGRVRSVRAQAALTVRPVGAGGGPGADRGWTRRWIVHGSS